MPKDLVNFEINCRKKSNYESNSGCILRGKLNPAFFVLFFKLAVSYTKLYITLSYKFKVVYKV